MPIPADDDLATLVRTALARHCGDPAISAIYLFGSAATGQSTPESDLDIAVLTPRQLPETSLFEAGLDLGRDTGRDVDLVDLRRASTVLAAQVVAHGRRIAVTDRFAADRFDAETYSEYASLAERRAAAITAFRERYRDG